MTIVVPTGSTPTVTDFLSQIRLDLFDAGQRVDDAARWSDIDLIRALRRANHRYSTVAPYLKQALIPTWPYSRLYANPTDAWWIDAVEYPHGLWPRWYQAVEERISTLVGPPSDPNAVLLESGGGLSSGEYTWAVSFVVPGPGETEPFPCAPVSALAGQQAILSQLPLGPYEVSDRNIYRTLAGGSVLYFVANAGDNVSTTLMDTRSDLEIAEGSIAPTKNTTGGIRQFELQISDERLPVDGCGFIGLRYAVKHQLDADGSTIPERHWDVITLGAEMFAVMAYLVPTADNFHFVDGQFRDQVDDTSVPTAWLAIGKDLEARFQNRLDEVRDEESAGVAAIGSWGDKPARWDRL